MITWQTQSCAIRMDYKSKSGKHIQSMECEYAIFGFGNKSRSCWFGTLEATICVADDPAIESRRVLARKENGEGRN